MKPDEQRIAIAEACGWKRLQGDEYSITEWLHPQLGLAKNENELPDYLSDLNAMHEAEKAFDGEQWLDYLLYLCGVCNMHLDSATAAQRAEAFLRAIGKWRDETNQS